MQDLLLLIHAPDRPSRAMAVVDGLTLGREAHNACELDEDAVSGSHARIVAVTASAFDDDLPEIRNSGADDVLRKPFRRDALLRIIEGQLARLASV